MRDLLFIEETDDMIKITLRNSNDSYGADSMLFTILSILLRKVQNRHHDYEKKACP